MNVAGRAHTRTRVAVLRERALSVKSREQQARPFQSIGCAALAVCMSRHRAGGLRVREPHDICIVVCSAGSEGTKLAIHSHMYWQRPALGAGPM